METKKLISIVVPVYNEQDNIPVLYEVASRELITLAQEYEYEFIFIDDGSTDRSWDVLQKIAACDDRVSAFSFSRNFGHQAALMAGYSHAKGDAIVSIDADMQHPPELILEMVRKWENGADVVYARKINRKDNIAKKSSAFLFYKLLDLISDVKIPRNVSDFRLIDKKVLAVVLDCKDKSPYLRGLVAWSGFRQEFIDCHYFKRFSGQTGYTWKKMFKLAWDGITGFSMFPLRLAAYIGMMIIFAGMVAGFYMLYHTFTGGVHFMLVTWLAEALVLMLGMQFLMVWLLGEYVGRIHRQEKGRPLYVVAKKADKSSIVKTAHIKIKKTSVKAHKSKKSTT
ncbi:glycosyltransferase [bacterium]|nr:glycosyltransferase [bacterium]